MKTARWTSRILFSWVEPYFKISKETVFQQSDHPSSLTSDDIDQNFELLAVNHDPKQGIVKAIRKTYGKEIWFLVSLCIAESVLQVSFLYSGYLMTEAFNGELKKHGSLENKGSIFFWLLAMIGSSLVQGLVKEFSTFRRSRLAMRVSSTVTLLLYKKVTRIGILNSTEVDEGSITNTLQQDCERLKESASTLHHFLFSILDMLGSIFLGCLFLGPIFIVLVVLMVVFMYPNFPLMRLQRKYTDQLLAAKDRRVNYWRSVINSIKYFKLRAYENKVFEKIVLKRDLELKYSFKIGVIMALWVCFGWVGPVLALLGFLFLLIKYFTMFSVEVTAMFIRIYFGINCVIQNTPSTVEGLVSIAASVKRIDKLLMSQEVRIDSIIEKLDKTSENGIEIQRGDFFWNSKAEQKKNEDKKRQEDSHLTNPESDLIVSERNPDKSVNEGASNVKEAITKEGFKLRNINFRGKRGQRTFIIGKVGSGKSSLLYAIMGDMELSDYARTRLSVAGSIGFVSQRSWIMNTTIRQNILLDKELDEEKLAYAIKYSCLEEDLKSFPKGVDNETGESGEALSGGQKARLSLAQVIYQDFDILLFDDILSALDNQTGTFIMEETIVKQLAKKTVIIATHALQYLRHAEYIYLLDEGRIEAEGQTKDVSSSPMFEVLMSRQEKALVEVEEKAGHGSGKEAEEVDGKQEVFEGAERNEEVLRLVMEEDREVGVISFKTFKIFVSSVGFGYLFSTLLLCFLATMIENYSMYRLAKWAGNYDQMTKWESYWSYCSIGLTYTWFGGIRSLLVSISAYFVSRKVHARMVYAVLHSRVEEFLQRVPTGRILNRFSTDLGVIDNKLNNQLRLLVHLLGNIFAQAVLYGGLFGLQNFVFIAVLAFLTLLCQRKYMAGKREFIRLESISKSPTVSLFSDTVKGLSYLRYNLGIRAWLQAKYQAALEDTQQNSVVIMGMDGWYRIRGLLLSNLVVLLPGFICLIYFVDDLEINKLTVFILVGSGIAGNLSFTLEILADFQSLLIALERCLFFENIQPEEQYQTYSEDLRLANGDQSNVEVLQKNQVNALQSIVTEGAISFRNVSAKYSCNPSPVIKNVSMNILPKEKIGVIGRTGSGKSSLTKLIWRSLIPYEGSIEIDGVDISEVDLKSLRSQISVLTQDCYFIEGSLRENIDLTLTDETKDEEISKVLNELEFGHRDFLESGLNMKVEADGTNLSAGEKQVINFARSIVDKKKILILDEATASIDLKTEQKVQNTLTKYFCDSTVLVIAHRIQTILNCDRILVLDEGKIEALDTPSNLMQEEDSYFRRMLTKMNNE